MQESLNDMRRAKGKTEIEFNCVKGVEDLDEYDVTFDQMIEAV